MKILTVYITTAVIIALALIGNIRLPERLTYSQTADEKHVHKVFVGNPITTNFIATSQGLSAIGVAIKDPKDTSIHVTIQNNSKNVTLVDAYISANTLGHIEFLPQAQSRGQQFLITLEAKNLTKQTALMIPYESDATINPNNKVWQGTTPKQGSLGLTEYEQPTVALTVWRWLTLSHQRPIWVGVALISLGFLVQKKITHTSTYPVRTRVYSTPYIHYAIIVFSIFIVYWPAIHLFFYSDDVPILARITMWSQNPLLLFTPHPHIDVDTSSQFGFDFYRPISFTLYPLLLHLLLAPSAPIYYGLNIAIFAGISCAIFYIANHITRSKPVALFITALWAFHSSKLGLLYWWSSAQDLLASFFSMLSLALFLHWQDNQTYLKKSIVVTLFLLGLFSKEYVIVLPIIIFLLAEKKNISYIRTLSPFIIAIGAFLILNTALLGDPTLPAKKHTNQTYMLSMSPIHIIRNAIVYSSFTAESRLWSHTNATLKTEQWLSDTLELWRLKTAGPYYPGVILMLIAPILLLLSWRNKQLRNNLFIGYVWWILFIAPFLLFTSDWRQRWLTLATFGSSLIAGVLVQKIIPKKMSILLYAMSFVIVMYGYIIARDSNLNRFFIEQSAYTKTAYAQLKEQEKNNPEEKRIILVGIIEDQETSLNAYLFRVFAKNKHAEILYADSLENLPREADRRSGDIVINMTGITPYYPESEK